MLQQILFLMNTNLKQIQQIQTWSNDFDLSISILKGFTTNTIGPGMWYNGPMNGPLGWNIKLSWLMARKKSTHSRKSLIWMNQDFDSWNDTCSDTYICVKSKKGIEARCLRNFAERRRFPRFLVGLLFLIWNCYVAWEEQRGITVLMALLTSQRHGGNTRPNIFCNQVCWWAVTWAVAHDL